MASIFYISGKPSKDVPGVVKRFVSAYLRGDRTVHLLACAALTVTMIWALWPNFRGRRRSIAFGGALSAACGAVEEWHQLHVPGRRASARDFVFGLLAVLAVCLVWGVGQARYLDGDIWVAVRGGDGKERVVSRLIDLSDPVDIENECEGLKADVEEYLAVVRLARQSADTWGIARRMRVSERRVRQILAEETGGNGFRKMSSARPV